MNNFIGDCAEGFYCPGSPEQIDTATPAQFACPLGHFCGNASIKEERCPSGTYQNNIGRSDCIEVKTISYSTIIN